MRGKLSCAEQLLPSTAQDPATQTATAIRRIITSSPLKIEKERRNPTTARIPSSSNFDYRPQKKVKGIGRIWTLSFS